MLLDSLNKLELRSLKHTCSLNGFNRPHLQGMLISVGLKPVYTYMLDILCVSKGSNVILYKLQ